MFATLKYGIGREVVVPVSGDTVASLSDATVQEAIRELLKEVGEDPEGTAGEITDAVENPLSVIEVRTPNGYTP